MAKDTELLAAMADTSQLPTFDGKQVARTTVAVTNAGDGLSQAMAVDPQVMHLGDRGYLVLEYEVSKVGHVPIQDTDLLTRVHTLRAERATLVDADLVQEHLERQSERIVRAREAAAGIQRLPGQEVDPTVEELEEAHGAGLHATGLVDRCPQCQEELEAMAAEAAPAPDNVKALRPGKSTDKPADRDLRVVQDEDEVGAWWVVDRSTGEKVSGPHSSRTAARNAKADREWEQG